MFTAEEARKATQQIAKRKFEEKEFQEIKQEISENIRQGKSWCSLSKIPSGDAIILLKEMGYKVSYGIDYGLYEQDYCNISW